MSKALFAPVALVAACAAAVAGCTMQEAAIPDLAGPSTFAMSLRVTATPDNIVEDGSQSVIVVSVAKPDGTPDAGVALRLNTYVDGIPVDGFGSLSSRTIYTDSSGKAATIYTAPVAGPFYYGGPPQRLQILATPIGTNYEVSSRPAEQVTILMTPPPVPFQPGGPQATVSYTPASPKVGETVHFDASGSQPGAGQSNISYYWDFGDGLPHEEHGVDASHAYQTPGTYIMVLGVTDGAGRVASTFRTIVVTK